MVKRMIRRFRRKLAERIAAVIMGGDSSIMELFAKANDLDDLLDAYQNDGASEALAMLAKLS